MKHHQLKLKEIEVFHTPSGTGVGRVQGRGKWRECRYHTGVNTVTLSRTFSLETD
jgi:hypothetical protein